MHPVRMRGMSSDGNQSPVLVIAQYFSAQIHGALRTVYILYSDNPALCSEHLLCDHHILVYLSVKNNTT